MKANPESMAQAIGDALARKGALATIGRVTVEQMAGQSRRVMTPCIVVRGEGCDVPHAFDLQVDRDALPPGIADEIADAVITTAADPVVRAEHAGIQAMLAPFTSLLPAPSTLARDTRDSGPHTRFSLFCHALDHTLVRGLQRITDIYASIANDTATRSTGCETRRAAMLDGADGIRQAALLCCPVAERMMALKPDQWRPKLVDALDGKAGIAGFIDGLYRPMVHFGGGVRWRQSTLMVDMEMPETMRSALPGRPLSDVFRHPCIPDDITVTGTAQRLGDGEVYVRTDAQPVRLSPSLERLGIEV